MNITVLDHDVDAWRPYLNGLQHSVNFGATIGTARPDVLLAPPDLAAEYLEKAGMPPVWIQSTWAGVAPLIAPARERGIIVTGIKGLFGPPMAEYVFAWLLGDVLDTSQLVKSSLSAQWHPQGHGTLSGKTLTVIGAGDIGGHIAAVAHTFEMQTIGVSRSGQARDAFDMMMTSENVDDVLPKTDYLIMCLPETSETTAWLNAERLAMLPSHCFVVNVGRGNSIDEAALVNASKAGNLRRVVLDVFATEPLPTDHDLWRAPGVTITPHIAAVSHPDAITRLFIENLARFETGQPMLHQVDLDAGY